MATTSNGHIVPTAPLGLAAWHHFSACYAVNPSLSRKEIIDLGVLCGHNRNQLSSEWTHWFKTRDLVHAPYVDREPVLA